MSVIKLIYIADLIKWNRLSQSNSRVLQCHVMIACHPIGVAKGGG